MAESGNVEPPFHLGMNQEHTGFRGEENETVPFEEVEGADAEMIAGQIEPAATGIVDGDGKGTSQTCSTGVTLLLVEAQHEFGVTIISKGVAVCLEIVNDFVAVVKICVDDNMEGAIL